ncbi:MAG: Modification methylase DpnIIB [Firmicutes bacterium ADurb.Bin193]|nr:MAG: Modification methylase DpnIIB [Firmicutes bacterium ADurb.Bin193]
MNTTERFEKVNINKLIPYARNARTHSKEQILQLRASLREFGFVNPVIVDKDFNIIAGHGRVLAAKEEGLTEIPCVFAQHLTEAQKRAYILADNRLALNAGWDEEMLSVELSDLKGNDFDLSLLGFYDNELEKLLGGDKEAQDDDFDVDEAAKEPAFVLPGDIWLLGRHRLMCGDSTNPDDMARLMDGKSANCVLTDPPYNIAYDKSKVGTIKNDNQSDEQFYNFLLSAFSNMEKVMAQDACIYVFHADTEGLNFRKAFDAAGFKLSSCCIWEKNTFTLGRSDYMWIHEPCLYGWKKSGKHIWHGDRRQSTVWHCDKPAKSELHPTQKPIQLLAIPLQNSTITNSIVLDPFAGSASTLICCEQLGRDCYTMELDETYASVSVKRYISQVNSDEDVYVIRNGEKIRYRDIPKEGADE